MTDALLMVAMTSGQHNTSARRILQLIEDGIQQQQQDSEKQELEELKELLEAAQQLARRGGCTTL